MQACRSAAYATRLGEVAQVTAAFVIVQAALNWLVDNYSGLADCLSSINRVASLLLALDELEGGTIAEAGQGAKLAEPVNRRAKLHAEMTASLYAGQ
jgi:ABC-type uncharacterized transport system fused permease/ATPase subunit